MAWLLTNKISLPDGPPGQWTEESAEAIRRANAEVVSRYSTLPPDDLRYIKSGDAPAGLLLPEPENVREYVVKEMAERLPDALTPTVVSERIRRIVEELEPRVHQFFPTRVLLPDGSKSEGWWNMRACHRLDAIAFELCERVYEHRPRPKQYPNWYYYRSGPNATLVARKEVIAGKAIWYDWRFHNFFICEELGRRFINDGIRGRCLPVDELGRSMHVDEA